MNTKSHMKRITAISGFALIGLMLTTSVDAANPELIVVQVTFVAPISITGTNSLEFGWLDTLMVVGEQVIITPAGGVTDADSNIVGGTQAAATANVIATPGRAINILVTPVTTGTGYFLTAWMCDYDGDIAGGGACDGGGLSETSVSGPTEVRVGVTLESDVAPVAGDQDGSFNLTVAYE